MNSGPHIQTLPPDAPPASALWETYGTARLLALAPPLDEDEQATLPRAAALIQQCLGCDHATATRHAHRALLFRRERVLHEIFMREMPAPDLVDIVDSTAASGLDHLLHADHDRGRLIVSLHYGPYSSLLVLWLAHAVERGLINRFTVLTQSGYVGYGVLTESRWEALEAAGMLSRQRFTVIDRTVHGPAAAARTLLDRLQQGDVALVFADAHLLATGEKGISLSLGQQSITLQRGVAWLAERAECAVIPAHIRPHRADGHQVVFGPARNGSPADAVRDALQDLLDHAIAGDPAPWEGWLRDWHPGSATAMVP